MGEITDIGKPHRNKEFAAKLREVADSMSSGRIETPRNLVVLWTDDDGLDSVYEGEVFSVLGMLSAAQTEIVLKHQVQSTV